MFHFLSFPLLSPQCNHGSHKGISLTPESEFRMKFSAEVANPEVLSLKSIALYAYRGPGEAPRWYDTTKGDQFPLTSLNVLIF